MDDFGMDVSGQVADLKARLSDLAQEYDDAKKQRTLDEIRKLVEDGQRAYWSYAQAAGVSVDKDLLATLPDCFLIIHWHIDPTANIPEALGLLKDWTTTLISVETAAIGVVGAVLASDARLHFTSWQKGALVVASFCFLLSIITGALALNMLPACAQRLPSGSNSDKDIYSIVIIRKWYFGTGFKKNGWQRGDLSDHTTWFSAFFYLGMIAFFGFIIASVLP
jgi:hypothetical protein